MTDAVAWFRVRDLAGKLNSKEKLEAHETLERAKVLLRRGWARNHFALNKELKPVSCLSEEADSFCISGAISRAYYGAEHSRRPPNYSAPIRLADTVVRKSIPRPTDTLTVGQFNDYFAKSIDDVLALLDAAQMKILYEQLPDPEPPR